MTVCFPPADRPPRVPLENASGGPWLGHLKAAPAAELRPYVDHYWLTRWDRRGRSARTAVTLLEPCVHLQIRPGSAEVVGVVRGTYSVPIEGVGAVIGVRFRPGGFYPFVGQSVGRWTDRTVPSEEILPMAEGASGWEHELWNEVDQCAGGPAQLGTVIREHLDKAMQSMLMRHDGVAGWVADLCGLAARLEARRVGDLARAGGCSERTLYRLFARYVGVSPAWVLRRYRVHAAAERLTGAQGFSIPEVAYELGYCDQAHLIRDFRDTVGVTPGAYVRAFRTAGSVEP